MAKMHYHAKFRQNRSNGWGDKAIFFIFDNKTEKCEQAEGKCSKELSIGGSASTPPLCKRYIAAYDVAQCTPHLLLFFFSNGMPIEECCFVDTLPEHTIIASLQAQYWIPMLSDCTSASNPLSQEVRWRPRGPLQSLSLIHIWRCRRSTLCRSRWSPYH